MAFDIELFPNSEAAKRMLGMVSPVYDKSYVGKWLYQVMGLEMDEARLIVESIRDQCFIERCTWGMRYWEERYGIEVDESKSLEDRRKTILSRCKKRGALSPAHFEDFLTELSGRSISIIEDNKYYCFSVQIQDENVRMDYAVLIKRINEVKPSHLAYSLNLVKKGILNLYHASVIHEVKKISFTDCE